MVDLNLEMAELWASLGAAQRGRGRVVQFISARRGEGASTVAREFARFGARRAGRRVWLVDLDLNNNGQYAAVSADAKAYGALGPAAAASPDGSAFFTVQPPYRNAKGQVRPDGDYLVAHSAGGPQLWVTRFRREVLKGPQAVSIVPAGDYWKAMRRQADLVVVDSPSADRSQAGLAVAPFMDDTVLVVAADEKQVKAPAMLRDAVGDAGGRVAGVFMNRTTVETPRFLKGLLPG